MAIWEGLVTGYLGGFWKFDVEWPGHGEDISENSRFDTLALCGRGQGHGLASHFPRQMPSRLHRTATERNA